MKYLILLFLLIGCTSEVHLMNYTTKTTGDPSLTKKEALISLKSILLDKCIRNGYNFSKVVYLRIYDISSTIALNLYIAEGTAKCIKLKEIKK